MLRQEMVGKLLLSQSYHAEEVLGASQALDRVLNCYDCLRFNRSCENEMKCESRSLLLGDSYVI